MFASVIDDRGQDSMGHSTVHKIRDAVRPAIAVMMMRSCDVRNRHYYYAEANSAQSTGGAMKTLFFTAAACLVLSLSSSAQAEKAKFADQYCIPYCKGVCAKTIAKHKGQKSILPNTEKVEDSPEYRRRCMSHCVTMCRELGH